MEKLNFKTEVFEGPLDLLLHLISQKKVSIFDVSVIELIDQYIQCMNDMQENDLDISSEFLEMAARLIYIKTVSLLPKHEDAENLQNELLGELIEYKVCKEMAAELSQMANGFDYIIRPQENIKADEKYKRKHDAAELLKAYISAVSRSERRLPPPISEFNPIIHKKIVPVSGKVVYLLRRLRKEGHVKMLSLFRPADTKSDIVATFLALLELLKSERVTVSGSIDNPNIIFKDDGDTLG